MREENKLIKGGSKKLDWQLNVAVGSEKSKYIILGFHDSEDNYQKQNSALFNHLGVSNAQIDLNSERYAEINSNI